MCVFSPRLSCLVGVLPRPRPHRRSAHAAADLRAAAHLSEMRAGPEAAHEPGPVHLLTAAHPREPERAAAAGRTQRGTASHRRRGAAPRCQEQRAAGGSVQVEDERRTGEPVAGGDPPSGSEVRGRRTGAAWGERRRRRSELCSNRKDAEDARLQMPSPGYPARVHGPERRLGVPADTRACQSKPRAQKPRPPQLPLKHPIN